MLLFNSKFLRLWHWRMHVNKTCWYRAFTANTPPPFWNGGCFHPNNLSRQTNKNEIHKLFESVTQKCETNCAATIFERIRKAAAHVRRTISMQNGDNHHGWVRFSCGSNLITLTISWAPFDCKAKHSQSIHRSFSLSFDQREIIKSYLVTIVSSPLLFILRFGIILFCEFQCDRSSVRMHRIRQTECQNIKPERIIGLLNWQNKLFYELVCLNDIPNNKS